MLEMFKLHKLHCQFSSNIVKIFIESFSSIFVEKAPNYISMVSGQSITFLWSVLFGKLQGANCAIKR